MKYGSNGGGRMTLRTRRRMIVAGVFTLLLAGAAFGAATARGPGGAATATRPAATQSAKDAAKAQYAKAKDLYDAGKYADAQVENERALALDPTNVDATLMKRVLEGKLAGGGGAAGTTTAAAGKPGLLTATQISVIRLLEMQPNEPNVRGKIDRPVLEEFWNEVITKDPLAGDKSKRAMDAFLMTTNFPGQLQRIKEANVQKYLEKVTITSDPQSFQVFRNGAHKYAMDNCATSECHGGEKGGNFRLVGGSNTPEQIYTNFYILAMYTGKDGGKMIDRDSPEKSLILQYGLPWANATFKHPKVETRKIPNMQDTRFRTFPEWIKTLAFPKPNYGITFELPGSK